MSKPGFFDNGFGDLMRKLVKVLEILISASTGTASTTGRGNRRVPRRLAAFIHIITIIIIIINLDTNP